MTSRLRTNPDRTNEINTTRRERRRNIHSKNSSKGDSDGTVSELSND